MKTYLVITAITLSACSHRAESTSTVATSTPPSADVAPAPPLLSAEPLASKSAQAQGATPDAGAKPSFSPPSGTSVVASNGCSYAVDAAPGKPASSSLPAGSVYIGCAIARLSNDNQEEYVPTIIEWDVAGGRVLRSVDLPLKTPMERADKVRIATFQDNVYVALTMGERSPTQLVALDADLRPRETRSLGISTSVSLEVNEEYLAVSYRPFIDDTWQHPIKVELFDANDLTSIATRSVGTAELDLDSSDALEFFGDQLYVVAISDFTAPPPGHPNNPTNVPFVGVFAMSLPSLEIVRAYKSAKKIDYLTTLQSAAGHIILTAKEGYEELTADLKPIRKHKRGYADAFDPKTGRFFSCADLQVTADCCCGVVCSCHAFWTGLEAAIVANLDDYRHTIFGRLKDLPRRPR
ncbi:MAG: hypothetical protein FWD73_01750 [Polyangiaceae bacterium]|nr:hypothetical protein [Polyangiaceae bacterium]